MIKALKNFRNYGIPWHGHPALHEELAWFATEDDHVLGLVLREIQRAGEYRANRRRRSWTVADLETARIDLEQQRTQADAGDPFARITVKYFEAKVRDIEQFLGILH
jgi:hypothetical protein